MNSAQQAREASRDLTAAAIARLLAPVDEARALYLGVLVVGHRHSVDSGEMCWATPGGGWDYTQTLAKRDPLFQVLNAPHPGWLREQKPVLAALLK